MNYILQIDFPTMEFLVKSFQKENDIFYYGKFGLKMKLKRNRGIYLFSNEEDAKDI